MQQTPCLIRIGRVEFVRESRLSVKQLCFCLVNYNEFEYIRLISIWLWYMHHNLYIVMHIIYGKVYSLLKLTLKRAPFVVVSDDQECVCRHFRSNCDGGFSHLLDFSRIYWTTLVYNVLFRPYRNVKILSLNIFEISRFLLLISIVHKRGHLSVLNYETIVYRLAEHTTSHCDG